MKRRVVSYGLFYIIISVLISSFYTGCVFYPKYEIKGKVTNETTGEPIEGATVEVKTSAETLSTKTDTQGEFLITNLSQNSYSIKVNKTGYIEKVESSVPQNWGISCAANKTDVVIKLIKDETQSQNSELARMAAVSSSKNIASIKGIKFLLFVMKNSADMILGSNNNPDTENYILMEPVSKRYYDTGYVETYNGSKEFSEYIESFQADISFDTIYWFSYTIYPDSIYYQTVEMLSGQGSKTYTKDGLDVSKPKNTIETTLIRKRLSSSDTYGLSLGINMYFVSPHYMVYDINMTTSFPADFLKSSEEITGALKIIYPLVDISDTTRSKAEIYDKIISKTVYKNGNIDEVNFVMNADGIINASYSMTKKNGKKDVGNATVASNGEVKNIRLNDEEEGVFEGSLGTYDKTTGNASGSGKYIAKDKSYIEMTISIDGKNTPQYFPDDVVNVTFAVYDKNGDKIATGKLVSNPDGSGDGEIKDTNGNVIATFAILIDGEIQIK